jgi:hypothetical protein
MESTMSKVLVTEVHATRVALAVTKVAPQGAAKPEPSHSESLRAATAVYREHNLAITRAQEAAPLAIVREHLAAADRILETLGMAKGAGAP